MFISWTKIPRGSLRVGWRFKDLIILEKEEIMGFLVKINNDKTEVIKSKSFRKEEDLQEIVKKFPEIIPLEEINEDFDSLLVIGREFSLMGAGSIDLLAIDTSGLITIIEFKLEKNADIRKVVAQVIEYAANLWEMSYFDLDEKVKEYFKSNRCAINALKNKTLVKAVKWHFDRIKKEETADFLPEEFITTVSNNLQNGEFRLIIFCDNVDDRTKRTVEYLNSLSNLDIYCVSTDAFEVEGKQFFKSSLITKISKKKKYAGKITFEDFMNSIPQKFQEIYKHLDEKINEVNGYYSWGTKGFAFYLPIKEKKFRPFCAFPDYIELISEKHFAKYVDKETVSVAARKDYEERIRNIAPFKSSFKDDRMYPSYKYDKMKPDDLKRYFDLVIDWHKKWFS